MRRIIAVGIVAGALLASVGAHAEGECSTDLIVFSYPAGVNSQVAVCVAAEEEARTAGYDPRLINPGSDSISVRYTVDLGAATPTLTAVVDGLGFDAVEVTLTRVEAFPGLFAYDSDLIIIPEGPTASGCITAMIPDLEVTTGFHTVGANC